MFPICGQEHNSDFSMHTMTHYPDTVTQGHGVTTTLLYDGGYNQGCRPYLALKQHVAFHSDGEIEVLHEVGTCWPERGDVSVC